MALSDYDKKYLDKRRQQAVLTYKAQYERAIREGNRQAAQMAHEGAEAIRRLAGYSGGDEGNSFLKPAAEVSKTISVSTNGKTSYQTVPAASAATVERADELDKLPTPNATRQDRSSRGGGFGSTRAGGFGGTGGSTSLATRIGQGAVSGLAEAGALLSATAGTVMDVRGGTGMTPVYREQTQALTRQIDALEKELHDPALTARERQDANDALRIAREQRNVYTQATAANQGTAQKLYETTDEGLRIAQEQAEKSVRGTSGLERAVLFRVPGMTQNAAITGLNLVAPWLGTTTAVLGDAGAAETRYRHDSGADYDAKAAAALGARVIGGDTARILAGELVRDYAETLRELYAERRRQAAPPQLAEPDRPRLPQSAYADALSRLEDSNGTDLTKPVSAYSAPPSVIELPETLQSTTPAPAPQSALADIYREAYNTRNNIRWWQASGKVGDGDGYSKITAIYHIDPNNSARISQKLSGFEEKYRTSEIEHSLVIAQNGAAYEVSGISGAVNTELVGADALEGSTIIHNHPIWDGYDKGDSFSLDDIMFAARNRAGKQYLSSGTRKDAFLYTGRYDENDIRNAYHKARQDILKRAFETGEPIQFEQEEIMKILGKYLEGFEYYEDVRF